MQATKRSADSFSHWLTILMWGKEMSSTAQSSEGTTSRVSSSSRLREETAADREAADLVR